MGPMGRTPHAWRSCLVHADAMTPTAEPLGAQERHTVQANGIGIHYVEAGSGDPLILLHGGLVSTSELWAPTPISYAAFMERLGQRFHVVAPDARTSGRTGHTDGPVSASLLADDVAALIEALGLERPPWPVSARAG